EAPEAWLARVNGIFAFVLWDRRARRIVIARDHMGICPLYWGHDADGRLWVASEMKAIARMCPDVALFPPGHVHDSARAAAAGRCYHCRCGVYDAVRGVGVDKAALRLALEQAVHRQLMGDVPYCVLLSGGLDSSLVAACAARFARKRVEDDDRGEAWWPR